MPRDWRNYAALDVELLIELETRMRADLKAAGKEAWAEEEFRHILAEGTSGKPRHEHPVPWLRVSHITSLRGDRRALAVARALWTKRDELAHLHDIAPTLLLSDQAIIEASLKKPHNAREFRAIRSLNERVRVQTGGAQDKMFERYAPNQREIKPSVWKHEIQEALPLPESELPVVPLPAHDKDGAETNGPKSMRSWSSRHPKRLEVLKKARRALNQIAEDTSTPAEVLLKPQILKNLCWTDEPGKRDVAAFLAGQGAREWQVRLVAASLSHAIV